MTDASIGDLLAVATDDGRVLAVLLYGSRARGDERPDSDTDVCIVLSPEAHRRGESPQA